MSTPKEYDASQSWSAAGRGRSMAYPAEYVIRMFKGKYPRLDLPSGSPAGKRICDVGCGDGRHVLFLHLQGMVACGTEISAEMVQTVRANLAAHDIDPQRLQVGFNHQLPYEDQSFDYLLSWNACYYMQNFSFEDYVREFARVLKPGGTLVFSIPQRSAFIYKDALPQKPGYCVIQNDPCGIRVGEIMRLFSGVDEIALAFSSHFEDIVFGEIKDDCFGFAYHWHIGTARRKS